MRAERANCVGSVATWLARWAERDGEFADDFAARGWRWLLLSFLHMFWLPSERTHRLLLAIVHWVLLPHLDVHEITDGNVNFSFGVQSRRSGKSLFVKQAQGYLKWQPDMELERTRMTREVRYFEEAREVLGQSPVRQCLPHIHHYDAESTVVVMEFLADYRVLFDVCFDDGSMSELSAAALGEYLGRLHARTLSPLPRKSGKPRRDSERRAVEFANPALRAIQLEHVYTVCFEKCERGRRLAADAAVMAEVAMLKAKYAGEVSDGLDRFALCHGDLHPGGVMAAADGRVKVIDPEFVVWGAPGLDVGSLLSGLILAHLYHEQGVSAAWKGRMHGSSAYGRRLEAGALRMDDALQVLWSSYVSAMRAEGVSQQQVERVGADTVGFAMMEVVRTSLGFAGARNPSNRIKSREAQEYYEDMAVGLVRHCLLHRHAMGMGVLIESLGSGRLDELRREWSKGGAEPPRRADGGRRSRSPKKRR